MRQESTRKLGEMMRDIYVRNPTSFRLFCPDETNSNRLGAVFEVDNRATMDPISPYDDHLSPDGRVMEVLSEHNCEGWLEGYVLSGRHGLFATYEAFAMVPVSMAVQHAKWLGECRRLDWRAPVPSLNVLLTSTCWRNDHNGFSHQGPGFIDTMLSMRGVVARVYLPPDANCLLSVADHCFRSHDYVNCIVIDKQPQLQWLDLDAAREHCARGASRWDWASTDDAGERSGRRARVRGRRRRRWRRSRRRGSSVSSCPDLKVRVVNVVDLDGALPEEGAPARAPEERASSSSSPPTPTSCSRSTATRGPCTRSCTAARHRRASMCTASGAGHHDDTVRHGRAQRDESVSPRRARGAPLPRARARGPRAARPLPGDARRHHDYVREHLDDMPEVRDWIWT